MPAGKLIEVEQADGVAHLEEMAVGGVVAAHGIHVHLLEQLGILEAHGGAEGTPCLGMEAVAVGALDDELGAVEVDAVVGAHLDGAEADAMAHAMPIVAQREGGGVEVRVLGVPSLGVGVYPAALLLIIRYGSAVDGEGDRRYRLLRGGQGGGHLSVYLAIGPRIDAHMGDMFLRQDVDVYGAVDASEEPPVGTALGGVDTIVGRLLAHEHLEGLSLAGTDVGGDVVGKLGETALMHGAHLLAIDPYAGVGHGAFENQFVDIARGHLEGGAIAPRLGGGLEALGLVETAVGVLAIPLQLPAAGHFDGAPFAALLSARAVKVPGAGVLGIGAAQVDTSGGIGGVLCGEVRAAQEGEE